MPYAALAKFVGGAILLAAIVLGLIQYGKNLKQNEWDASLTKQGVKSAEQVIAEAENTAKVEVRYIKVKGATEIVHQIVEKEVIKYVEHPDACRLTPEFERTVDAISRLYDPSAERMPSSSGPSGDAVERGSATASCTALIRAYQYVVGQLIEQRNAYEALVDWVRSDYEIQRSDVGRPKLTEE